LSHFLYSLKHRGFNNTCALGFKEWQKERELGIQTFGALEAKELSIDSASKADGHLYQPSSSVLFEKAMNLLPFNFSNSVFLDIGSGKGRALILAAEAGFKKVIGVEYANELNDMARANIETVKDRFSKTEFRVVQCDALTYSIAEEVDVIYLFNPFDERATLALAKQLKPVFAQKKRIDLIYVHPVSAHVFEKELGDSSSEIRNNRGILEVTVFSNHRTR